MKIECTQEALARIVSVVERVVGKKESLPVLSCLVFDAGKDTVRLQATNLETGVESQLSCDVQKEGKVAVPAAILSQTIRTLPKGKVTLELVGDNLRVSAQKRTALLKTIPHEEFPTLPKVEVGVTHTLPKTALSEGLESVLYAASQSLIRPELASIYIFHEQGNLVFVATDSFRLAEKKVSLKGGADETEILIPVKNAAELLYMLSQVEGETVTLSYDEAQLMVVADNTHFISRLIDALFPNYREIIPKDFACEATLLRGDFDTALKKARIFSGTQQQVELQTDPKSGALHVTASHPDVGEMNDALEASVTGEGVTIKFNLSYLTDAFTSIKAESMFLQFSGEGKPLVMRSVGDHSFMYLVMPLNR